jgi:hypothetical protein
MARTVIKLRTGWSRFEMKEKTSWKEQDFEDS